MLHVCCRADPLAKRLAEHHGELPSNRIPPIGAAAGLQSITDASAHSRSRKSTRDDCPENRLVDTPGDSDGKGAPEADAGPWQRWLQAPMCSRVPPVKFLSSGVRTASISSAAPGGPPAEPGGEETKLPAGCSHKL